MTVLLCGLFSCAADRETVRLTPDTTTVLRNPVTGWGLYVDIVGRHPDPVEWWKGLEPGIAKATHFYYRCRWSTLEPEEGKYAWKHDERFQKMIGEAKRHGLKLAFRVIVDSHDNAEQATPDYVRRAGAKGTVVGNRQFWNPNIDDPIFQKKFAAFIRAFGKEFDDPKVVDFVDGNGLGRWGEQHHLQLPNDKKEAVLEWISATYASAFKKVLLVYCFGSEFELEPEWRIAVKKYGYIPRRDGLGSCWFSPPQKEFINRHFPQIPLIGESCYWGLDPSKPPPEDRERKFKSVREVLEHSVTDALTYHANTLDLRNPGDLRVWMQEGPDLIDKFIAEGGYRLLPQAVEYPREMAASQKGVFQHRWINVGCGVCPNANPRWNKKYQVAFALYNEQDEQKQIAIHIDPKAEPSAWVKGAPADYVTSIRWKAPPGTYRLVTGIVDTTQKNRPGILCAVENPKRSDGWVDLGRIVIQ